MVKPRGFRLTASALGALTLFLDPVGFVPAAFAQTIEAVELDEVIITAEDQIKQALGASTISAEDLAKTPVVNDLAEIIRKMPGVNLSGTSPSGQRGNQRQIDIRGMGPENVLILIDGKPVLSRTSVKMGRSGERDTRGDSNWVPAELVERIEVLRGPAAARYGSGAAGGVVNILTKAPEDSLFQLGMHIDAPQSELEGMTRRLNLLWEKRLSDNLSLRLAGNYSKSEADDPKLNPERCSTSTSNGVSTTTCTQDAAPEGVINKDFSARLRWETSANDTIDFDLGLSRQGNLFSGDNQLGGTNLNAPLSSETNVMKRRTFGITHTGDYAWGQLKSYVQYEGTHNKRLPEGTGGSGEGAIRPITDATTWDEAVLDVISARSEAVMDRTLFGRNAKLTFGAELRHQRLDLSNYKSFANSDFLGSDHEADPITSQLNIGLYAEGNIEWNDKLTVTPLIRVDYVENTGTAVSGGLNLTYALTDEWTIKGGVARAFKAPTLYQISDIYVYRTNGNGCAYPYNRNGPCEVLGNSDLDPETSINSEIGIAYAGFNGINASLTYFHNNYRDKIQSGMNQVGSYQTWNADDEVWITNRVYQWANIPDAEVSGLEGSFAMPIGDSLGLTVNGTYMITSKQTLTLPAGTNGRDGQYYAEREVEVPLSLVPKYTINAQLDWSVNDKLTVSPSLVHYGKTEATKASASTGYNVGEGDLVDRDPYTLVNLAASYNFDNGTMLTAGVTNVFDHSVTRTGDGAQTYNEAGRAFYLGLRKTF